MTVKMSAFQLVYVSSDVFLRHGNEFTFTVMNPTIGSTNLKFLAVVIHKLKMDKSI
jgi:hypothetical protein